MAFKRLQSSVVLTGLSSLVVAASAIPAMAISGFLGDYAPGNFTFTSTPTDAGVSSSDLDTSGAASGTVKLYSPDDSVNGKGDLTGSGGAQSDWTITITPARAGQISFSWSFTPLDSSIGDDEGGYFLNSNYFRLASNDGTFETQNSTGLTVVPVSDSDVFGFRVITLSNQGGAGEFVINNFEFTPATPVPLESDALPVLISVGFLGGGIWVKRKLKGNKN